MELFTLCRNYLSVNLVFCTKYFVVELSCEYEFHTNSQYVGYAQHWFKCTSDNEFCCFLSGFASSNHFRQFDLFKIFHTYAIPGISSNGQGYQRNIFGNYLIYSPLEFVHWSSYSFLTNSYLNLNHIAIEYISAGFYNHNES